MSDFDFDELDKAVTGAIGSKDTASESEQKETTPVEEQLSPAEKAAAAMPAARRGASGRFMDMVHPSSDMRRSNAPTRRPDPVIQSVVKEEVPVIPEPPIFHEEESVSVPEETDTVERPLESPFLANAKIEKRPLGGSAPTGFIPPSSPVIEEAPEETLTDEVVEEASAVAETVEPAPAQEEELLLEAPDEPLLEATATPDADDPRLDEEMRGPTSITQQYKEAPRSDEAGGSIYDTEAYHKPITHAPKKHSSVWTIIWVILLIILGAGAGVAFYLYVLPLI